TAPPPLVERWLRLPVTERVDATGAVLTPLDPADLDAALDTLRGAGVEAVAICFMHAWANAAHEQAAGARARAALPAAYLSRSSALLPQVRFTERVSTTVLNAAVGPVLSRYLDRLITRLGAAGFRGVLLVMQSNGGVAAPAVARAAAATTLLSGPAAAPTAALAYLAPHGARDFLTVDMGGTSFDVCLVKDGAPAVTSEGRIARYPFGLPALAIHTIGAGGGSIGWLDDGGLLRMGPKSAGAAPGPACYGRGGTRPTCLLVPRDSSILCAAGLVRSDLRHDFVLSHPCAFERLDRAALRRVAGALEADARATLAAEGVPRERAVVRLACDVRYVGQY